MSPYFFKLENLGPSFFLVAFPNRQINPCVQIIPSQIPPSRRSNGPGNHRLHLLPWRMTGAELGRTFGSAFCRGVLVKGVVVETHHPGGSGVGVFQKKGVFYKMLVVVFVEKDLLFFFSGEAW